MKRATLLLDDAIYRQTKALSRRRGTTLKEVLNDLLRFALNVSSAQKKVRFKIPLHKRNGPRPGVDVSDRNSLYDLMDDGKF